MTDDATSRSAYRSEIESALLADGNRLGEVFRFKSEGMDAQSPDCGQSADCQFFGSGEGARRTRRFVKRYGGRLSEETRASLEALVDDYERLSRDDMAIEESNSRIPRGLAGIYVYTYSRCLKYPILPVDHDDIALLDRRVICDLLGFDEDTYEAVRRLSAKWCAEPWVHCGKKRPKNAKLAKGSDADQRKGRRIRGYFKWLSKQKMEPAEKSRRVREFFGMLDEEHGS